MKKIFTRKRTFKSNFGGFALIHCLTLAKKKNINKTSSAICVFWFAYFLLITKWWCVLFWCNFDDTSMRLYENACYFQQRRTTTDFQFNYTRLHRFNAIKKKITNQIKTVHTTHSKRERLYIYRIWSYRIL